MWLFFSVILWLEPLWQMLSFFICLLIFKFSSLKFINIFLKKLLDTIKTVSLVKKLSIFAFFITYWFSFLQLCLLLLLMLMFLFETGSFSLQCVLDRHSSWKALKWVCVYWRLIILFFPFSYKVWPFPQHSFRFTLFFQGFKSSSYWIFEEMFFSVFCWMS